MKRQIKDVLHRLGLRSLYQDKVRFSTIERWQLISSALGDNERSVLDIGCNLGDFTHRFAKSGCFALGIDASPAAIAKAQRRHRRQPRLAFAVVDVSPANQTSLPTFDVILCLSVFHYWYRSLGEDEAWGMVSQLIAKSQQFIFEPASTHGRYGQGNPPGFQENDERSIHDYTMTRLMRAATPAKTVRYLGKCPSMHGTERLIFIVE